MQRIHPGADGQVTLPPGTPLDTIEVSGRDLVVHLPDGTLLLIVDGAVYVPQLVIGGVEIPPINLAALLLGHEPQPAAGPPSSSGGNFAVPVGGLGDGLAIGDLLPPTALAFGERFVEDLEPDIRRLDALPGISIVTALDPGGATAARGSVDEAGLPARGAESPGSNPASNGETTIGTFLVTNGNAAGVDGPVSVNGIVLTGAVGQTITGGFGTLTITAVRPGAYDFSYTLADNTSGDNTSELFTVVVTNAGGQQATGTLTVSVVDDVPVARDDTATQTAENQPVVINAFANDTFGADGVAIAGGAVSFTQAASGTVSYNPASGLFTYTPRVPGATGDSFTYTITDGDGDRSTATVTIGLLGDSAPVITLGGAARVEEAGLPNGSDAASNRETTTGTIAVATGGDTLAALLVNGVDLTAGGTVNGASGTLTVVRGAGGGYTYSYTLTAPTSGDGTSDNFAVSARDSDGSTTGTTLAIAIVDDVPTARADIDRVTVGAGGMTTTALAGVDFGQAATYAGLSADGTRLALNGLVVDTIGGRLAQTIGGAGVVSPSDLAPGQGFTGEVDAYNDTPEAIRLGFAVAQSNVVIALNQLYREPLFAPAPDPERAIVTIGFADGTTTTVTVTATQTQQPGEGIITLDSAAFGGRLIATVTLSPDPSLPAGLADEYRNSYNATHPYSDFTLKGVSYSVATTTPGTTTVADGNVLTGIGGTDANATDGVADTRGADGASVTGVVFGTAAVATGGVGGTIAGAYGTLTLNADGSYAYTLNSAQPTVAALPRGATLTETFTYTITDGDGDTSTTTLTIGIDGRDHGVTLDGLQPIAVGGDVTVFEANLPGGSAPEAAALTQGGDFTISATDGYGSLTVGGTTLMTGGVFTAATLTTPLGNQLAFTGFDAASGRVSYSYTLNGAVNDPSGQGNQRLFESLNVVATDRDGSTGTGTLHLAIVDDTPIANADIDRVTAGSPGGTATSTVVVDFDRDATFAGFTPGGDTLRLDGLTVSAQGGALTHYLGASVSSPSDNDAQVFTREIDAYNDTGEAIRLDFATAQSRVVVTLNQLYEERLFSYTATDAEKAVVTIGFTDGSNTTVTVTGTATATPGEAAVTLDSAAFGGRLISSVTLAPDPSLPTLPAGLADEYRNSYNATHPYSDFTLKGVSYDVGTVTPPAVSTASGNVLTGIGGTDANGTDGVADVPGADGASVTGLGLNYAAGPVSNLNTPFAGEHGTLTLSANGSYVYALNNADPAVAALRPGATLVDRFTYTITDGDGDTASTTLTITIDGRPAASGLRLAAASETGNTLATTLALASVAALATPMAAAAETRHETATTAAAVQHEASLAAPVTVAHVDAAPAATATQATAATATPAPVADTHHAAAIEPLAATPTGDVAGHAAADPLPAAHDADTSHVATVATPVVALLDIGEIPLPAAAGAGGAAAAPAANAPVANTADPAHATVAVAPAHAAVVADIVADSLHGGVVAGPSINDLLATLPATPAATPDGGSTAGTAPALATADQHAAPALATGHEAAALIAAAIDHAAMTMGGGHDGVTSVAHAA